MLAAAKHIEKKISIKLITMYFQKDKLIQTDYIRRMLFSINVIFLCYYKSECFS